MHSLYHEDEAPFPHLFCTSSGNHRTPLAGAVEQAATYLKESDAHVRLTGMASIRGTALLNLAELARQQGDFARATALFGEVLTIARSTLYQAACLFSGGQLCRLGRHFSKYTGEHSLECLCWIRHVGLTAPSNISVWPHQHRSVLFHSVGDGPASLWIGQVSLRPDREGPEGNVSRLGNFGSRLAPGCTCSAYQENKRRTETDRAWRYADPPDPARHVVRDNRGGPLVHTRSPG